MSAEYKKYTILYKDGEDGFEAFSNAISYECRRDEIYSWLDALATSYRMQDYTVEVADASWTRATIQPDNLFETHFPK